MSGGSIDLTNIIESLRESFVDWAVAYVYAEEVAIPGLGEIVVLPIIGDIDRAIIRGILDSLSKSIVMQAFFLNTAIRKASEADDFVTAINAVKALPSTATQDEYETAERARMAAFRVFVTVTA